MAARSASGNSVGGVDPAHAAATAAGDRLDEDRVADRLGGVDQLVDVGRRLRRLEHRDSGGSRGEHRGCLVPGHLQDLGRRSDERHPGVGAGLGEVGVLGEEPVSRVHRVGAGLDRGPDDLVAHRDTPGPDGLRSPIWYDSSAFWRCSELRSSYGNTATELMPSSYRARKARVAISPRLATSTLRNTRNSPCGGGPMERAGRIGPSGPHGIAGPVRPATVEDRRTGVEVDATIVDRSPSDSERHRTHRDVPRVTRPRRPRTAGTGVSPVRRPPTGAAERSVVSPSRGTPGTPRRAPTRPSPAVPASAGGPDRRPPEQRRRRGR